MLVDIELIATHLGERNLRKLRTRAKREAQAMFTRGQEAFHLRMSVRSMTALFSLMGRLAKQAKAKLDKGFEVLVQDPTDVTMTYMKFPSDSPLFEEFSLSNPIEIMFEPLVIAHALRECTSIEDWKVEKNTQIELMKFRGDERLWMHRKFSKRFSTEIELYLALQHNELPVDPWRSRRPKIPYSIRAEVSLSSLTRELRKHRLVGNSVTISLSKKALFLTSKGDHEYVSEFTLNDRARAR